MLFRFTLILLTLTGLFGCEKTLSIGGPPYQRKAVLTGLLFPDSAISVRLTFTAPASTTAAFEPITGARVQLFDDGQLLGTLPHQSGGFYRTSTRPSPGHTYRVVADIPNYGQLDAEDRMPQRPVGALAVDGLAKGNPNNNPDFRLTLRPQDERTAYWFGFYVTEKQSLIVNEAECVSYSGPGQPEVQPCRFEDVLRSRRNVILTNSAYLDRFNSTYEGSGGTYLFNAFARYNPQAVVGQPVELTFTVFNQLATPGSRGKDDVNTIDLIAAGPNYDRFLRSAIQAQLNQITSSDDLLSNPFAEVTPVYTNVRGGLGIFGAVSVQRFLY